MLDPEAAPAFVLQLLHLSGGEPGLLAGDTAPLLAALIDAFDDDYASTLILSGGDNFCPARSLMPAPTLRSMARSGPLGPRGPSE